MSLRVGIVSLGCPRNLVDSESVLSHLKEKNITVTELDRADIAIVNTCAFIKEAKQESIETILNLIALKKSGHIKKVIVHGCLAQRYKDDILRNIKGIDALVGRLNLNGKFATKFSLTPKHFAYVKVSEGCANLCSYCVIPKIKGRLQSRSPESIIEQIKFLDKNNTREVNLVGQDITQYGVDSYNRPMLTDLVKGILKHTHNINWVRLLYLHPAHIDDALIDLIAKEKRICKYVDLPIQHINDRILKLMNRGISRKQIVSLIKKIRKRIKGAYIRSSIITGFPSESGFEFNELLDFLKEVKFERLGAFIYSREENTKARSFKDQIHYRTKKSRFDKIMSAQRGIAAKLNEVLLGTKREVLIDGKDEDEPDLYLARLEQDAPEVDGIVYVRSKRELHPGEFHKVNIIDTLEYDLVGQLA